MCEILEADVFKCLISDRVQCDWIFNVRRVDYFRGVHAVFKTLHSSPGALRPMILVFLVVQ